MKKFLFLIVILALAGLFTAYVVLPAKVENTVLNYLADRGFPDAKIEKSRMLADGMYIDAIQLDQDGFSTAEGITLTFNWFLNFILQDIDSINIKRVVHNDLQDRIDPQMISNWLDTKRLMALPTERLNVELVQFNLGTDFGDIRIEAKALINTLEDGAKTIQAVTWSRQYQLGFQIPVSGVVHADGRFLFESTFNEGKLNVGPMRISRLSGWASLEGQENSIKAFSTQLDSGAAEFFGLPLQDVSFALSQSAKNRNGFFRSNLSGMPSAAISADWSHAEEANSGALFFEIGQSEDFTKLVKQVLPDFNTSNLGSLNQQPLLLSLEYQPDRRFAGGPIPFELELSTKDLKTKLILGNVLLYPDSLDVKGSVYGKEKAVSDLLKLVGQDESGSKNKTIPIDFNLKSFLREYAEDNQG